LPGDTVELLIDRKGQLIKKEITLWKLTF
jgi:hypothetical protein